MRPYEQIGLTYFRFCAPADIAIRIIRIAFVEANMYPVLHGPALSCQAGGARASHPLVWLQCVSLSGLAVHPDRPSAAHMMSVVALWAWVTEE